MKRFTLQIISVVLGYIGATASGTDQFSAAVDEILSNNQTLAARRASTEAASLNLKADNNLADPEVEFEHQWGSREVGNKWSISVSQSFDWPGVYKRRAEATRSGAEAYKQLYLSELNSMKLRVEQTLIDYINARQILEMQNAVKANLDSIHRSVAKAYDCGEATVLDMRKIDFEFAEAETRCDEAAVAVDNLRRELISLNGGKYIDLSAIDSYPAMELKSEDYYAQQINEADPAYSAASQNVETARLEASATRMASLPGFTLGYIHNVEIGDHFNGLKAGITLPFFSNRHRRSASSATALAAQFELNDYIMTAEAKVRSDYASAKSYRKRLASYKEIFPSDGSDNYLALLRKSYLGGQMTFITYLYEINYYIDARTNYLNLVHNYNLTLASLNRFEQ